MYIFIRGLPGVGKTTIARRLTDELGWPVKRVDDHKIAYMNEHPDADFIDEVVPHSHEQFLDELQESEHENLITEGLFKDRDLVSSANKICENKSIEPQWFLIERDREKLLEVESNRERKVKNSPEELEAMEEKMNSIDIEGEICIKNDDLDIAVKNIMNEVRKHK